jgi:dTDP-glucose 4,6-dehydratase
MKKKIFVTGGGGFIGSHLVERLVKLGHKVKTIVPYNIDNSWGWIDSFPKSIKKNLEVISGDICDQNLILKESKGIEIYFHLAALISIPYSYKSPQSYISTNINGTVNLLEAARNDKTELFVQTSTSEVYGSAQTIPITESHPLNAQSPYAASKIAGDQLALSYHKSFNLPSLVLRPFNTYGPRQSLRAFIPSITTQIIELKSKIKLGNLEARRDFTYVSDTVDGYISAIGNKKCIGETIQLGTGVDFSMKETLDEIKKLTNKNIIIVQDKERMRPIKSEVNRLISSNKKAKKILNWSPKHSGKKGFKKGLQKTIEWFKDSKNLSHYKSDLYNF